MPWSWKSLIDLNEKASGQNVTDIGAPAATMEIVGMYHTKNNIHTIVGMLLLMMVYLRRTKIVLGVNKWHTQDCRYASSNYGVLAVQR